MNNEFQGEVLPPPTQRISFNHVVSDEEIPAFLRKNKSSREISEEPTNNVIPIREQGQQIQVTEEPSLHYEEPVQIPSIQEEPRDEDVQGLDATIIQPVDLDGLSVEELRKREEEIQKAIIEKQKAEKQSVIDQIVDVMNTYKIPIEDVVEAVGGLKVKRKGVKATIKYRDPATGATWSGRGKEPAWIKDKNRNDFLI